MAFLIYILVSIVTLLFLRDLIFRIFFIYPKTDWTGNYAAFIEEKFIPCWVVQNLKKRSNIEVVFLGISHLIDAIDPSLIEEKTGKRTYNVALYSIASQYSMELLSVMNYYPKLIFIDISTRYSLYNPENKMIKNIVRNWSNV